MIAVASVATVAGVLVVPPVVIVGLLVLRLTDVLGVRGHASTIYPPGVSVEGLSARPEHPPHELD